MKKEDIIFSELLKEYIGLQYDKSKQSVQKFMQEKVQSTLDSKNQLMDYISKMGKEYGQNITETRDFYNKKDEDILMVQSQYDEKLNEIDLIYQAKHQQLRAGIEILKSKELNVLIKQNALSNNYVDKLAKQQEELEQLVENGKIDKVEYETKKEILDERIKKAIEDKQEYDKLDEEKNQIRNQIKRCVQEIDKCIEDMNKTKKLEQLLREEKFHNINDTYLKVMEKKTFFSKAMGWFLNKLNGKKRFKDEILKPLKNGIDAISKEKIPALKEKTQNEINEMKEKIEQKEESIKESNYLKNAKDAVINGVKSIETSGKLKAQGIKNIITKKINSIKETAKEYAIDKPKAKYNYIIEKARNYKEKIVNNMVKELEENGRDIPKKQEKQNDEQEK